MPKAFQRYNMEDTIEEVIYIRLFVPGPFRCSFRPAMYLMNPKSCHPLVSVISTNIYGLLQSSFCASAVVSSGTLKESQRRKITVFKPSELPSL